MEVKTSIVDRTIVWLAPWLPDLALRREIVNSAARNLDPKDQDYKRKLRTQSLIDLNQGHRGAWDANQIAAWNVAMDKLIDRRLRRV